MTTARRPVTANIIAAACPPVGSASFDRFPEPVLEEVRWNGRTNVRGPAVVQVTVR